MNQSSASCYSSRGFSLLEVLVASAVLSIVLAILLGALTTTLALWRNTEHKLSADREARAADLLLAQDLAGAVMLGNSNLWPRVTNGALQFLTLKVPDYQSSQQGANIGDVCFVEYYFDTNRNTLTRLFLPSSITYSQILAANDGRFPAPTTFSSPDPANISLPQTLATNVLVNNKDAVRGNKSLFNEIKSAYFTILSTNHASGSGFDILPITGNYNSTNYPAAVEVTFAVTDSDTLANKNLLEKETYLLRNAALYSFRMVLPPPPGKQ